MGTQPNGFGPRMPELRGLQNDLLEILELNDHWVDLEDLAELH
jgi:hypothetical protein